MCKGQRREMDEEMEEGTDEEMEEGMEEEMEEKVHVPYTPTINFQSMPQSQ